MNPVGAFNIGYKGTSLLFVAEYAVLHHCMIVLHESLVFFTVAPINAYWTIVYPASRLQIIHSCTTAIMSVCRFLRVNI